MTWTVEKTHVNELEHPYWIDTKNEYGATASLKWDGCVHLNTADGTYLHICDLPEFIQELQELLELGKRELPDWNE